MIQEIQHAAVAVGAWLVNPFGVPHRVDMAATAVTFGFAAARSRYEARMSIPTSLLLGFWAAMLWTPYWMYIIGERFAVDMYARRACADVREEPEVQP